MLKYILIVCFFFLSSCMTTNSIPSLSQQSRVYVTINKTGIKEAKNKLIDACINKGLQTSEIGTQSVKCWKTVEGTKGILTQLLVGNSYSTPPTENMQFVLIQKNEDVRIEASRYWVETQMAFGQIRQEDLNRLNLQTFLNYLAM